MNWDKDIRFLAKRIDEQSNYLAGILKSMQPPPYGKSLPYYRAVELMTSAFKQRFYFEEKLWDAFQEKFKPGMKVEMKSHIGQWIIDRIYVEDDIIFIVDKMNNYCINAAYRSAGEFINELKIISQ